MVKLSDITEIKHVVLTDFGTTVFFSNKNKYEKKKTVSSEIWAAPELLNKKEEEINPQFVDSNQIFFCKNIKTKSTFHFKKIKFGHLELFYLKYLMDILIKNLPLHPK